MNYNILVDKLMNFFTRGRYEEELSEGKESFLKIAGVFDEESEDFEHKMSQFVDWYIFDRKLATKDATPIELAMQGSEYEVSEELLPYYNNLLNQVHSLFELVKIKKENVIIKDLFTKKKYIIKKNPYSAGFFTDQYFEARIFPDEDYYVFSRSFCFHPKGSRKYQLKEIKKVKKVHKTEKEQEQQDLLFKFFKMKHLSLRYKHIDIKDIYSDQSSLNI